jgi:hypothetical protein
MEKENKRKTEQQLLVEKEYEEEILQRALLFEVG